ncbi:Glycosyl transferase [Candidatus Desulfarcum epimagneticum]|uniref:Glycosyl transferase n=1 Tax=uncultured Desulfobacteraceae bacterium TaxID=218296 RepID=A0A484HGS6_9BACT|nr:Glycosyl transferase [uncultured Desulfobacteraceae bacterium]
MDSDPVISISIVSHGHGVMVAALLGDLEACAPPSIEVILTLNVQETLSFSPKDFSFPVTLIANERPKGFGANHNQAFCHARGFFFCALNPDIRLDQNPFPDLMDALNDPGDGVAAPLLKNRKGEWDQNARKFPTPWTLLKKMMAGDPKADYSLRSKTIRPDWVSGAFMLFPRSVYRRAGGFDERYFLYYEDVDLCRRLWRMGFRVLFLPQVSAVHDARYDSHRHPRFLKWHTSSACRFFMSNLLDEREKR